MAKKREDKEEKSLNTWIPIGVMIGSVVGMILFFVYDNFLYFGGCLTGGLLVGIMFGSIFAEEDVKIKSKKKKKK